MRNIAKFAGVHMYCDEDIIMDADNRFIMLHNGPKTAPYGLYINKSITIKLPEKKDVYDLFSEKIIAKNTDAFSVLLPECETLFFQLK